MEQMRHLGVYGVVINDNKILLVRKSRGAYIGKLDLPGGSIEHGEEPLQTLKREFFEETNSNVINANILCADSVIVDWVFEDKDVNMHHIGIIYDVEIEDTNVKEDGDGLDSLGAAWYLLDDLTSDEVSPLTWRALKLKGLK